VAGVREEAIVLPASLQQISIQGTFNQSITGVRPASLQQLSFGQNFNRPIVGVVWPSSLHGI